MKKRYHVIEEKVTSYFCVVDRKTGQYMGKYSTKECADLFAGLLNEKKTN